MKIAVFGAGGIGGYFGALLARSGHDVTLICRGAHLAAIQRNGLRIIDKAEEFIVDNAVATDTPEPGEVDVILNCVKLYDLRETAELMQPMIGPATMVVTIQNGVVAYDELSRLLDPGCVVPGTVFMSSHIDQPGVVIKKSDTSKLVFGEPDGTDTPRIRAFEKAGRDAGFDAQASLNIDQELWHKFVMLAGTAEMCCLSRLSVGPIMASPLLREQLTLAMQEAYDVAKARGIVLPDNLIADALEYTARVDPGAKVSMLEDLEAGKRLELDWIIGDLVRQGKQFGIPTPIADLTLACVEPYKNGTRHLK